MIYSPEKIRLVSDQQDQVKPAEKPGPTHHQLERIQELLGNPAMDADLITPERFSQLIATRGGAGVLINWLKNQIRKAGGTFA